MSPKKDKRLSIDELRSAVAPIAEKYGVKKIYLFGSVTRGDHNENSDHYLRAECGKIRTISVYSEFFQDIRNAVGSRIDVKDMEVIDTEFMDAVRTDGVFIYAQ